ncbi:MAG TPA: hypothetical protein VL096_16115 [Pirellulaceae bacterium]|nr:hypothetical protein [Pirellulaceae bacterium]
MPRFPIRATGLFVLLLLSSANSIAAELRVGFAEADITPKVDDPARPVWLAGYGPGRQANAVHDPIYVRCMVLADGDKKIAIACADLIGLQYPAVLQIRKLLPDYQYVLVSSTHSHEGPDVIGIWGRNFVSRGVDDAYLKLVVTKTAEAIQAAEKSLTPAAATYGTANDESLLGDSRKPDVRDGVLRTLAFTKPDKSLAGICVQWNCHPEALGSKNKAITADFVASTVAALKQKHACPVLYVSGAVGGLMAPPDDVKDASGKRLEEGDFEYARVYGEAVAALADKALDAGQPIVLTPFAVSARPLQLHVKNQYYRAAQGLGVLRRAAHVWTGDAELAGPTLTGEHAEAEMAVETEVAYVRLGELDLAAIPGEIYPELVYGKYPATAEEGVDFPAAELEPAVVNLLPQKKWLLIGLANDEIGYIIPKRQWDSVAPFAYQRKTGQYGEINSCGPDVAPLIMSALQRRIAELPRP